ncbi:methyltransferase-like protein 7A [Pollicipes pollicipes]|uniref:methyltransferase-like protein 7A n=1 Tax=Pollicipes pollicipes TaxID=41117 RepID=UPI001885A1EE|nr:methyltransferase-like protein 7A [Pollicipes pollicipes]XP_037079762.1 methyltransferase-like protein 7A [Pollicipes pollicipes]XP_037079763.1 methyltransferase-like protein 7A [Pollicipes pollicipes]
MWCWIRCLTDSIVFILGWFVLITVMMKIIFGPTRVQQLRDKVFAAVMNFIMKDSLRRSFESTKKELFSSLKAVKSAHLELQKKNALNILEVGVGTGTNLEYYPAGSRLLCVDPNAAFEKYFRRECEQKAAHLDPDIQFVTERGESMPSVADSSVDVVVITLVLCSVSHLDQMLREILRVLVPGGKFYFFEHIGDEPGTWRRRIQNALSDSGLWPLLFDGCVLNRDVEPVLTAVGFSAIEHHTVLVAENKARPRSSPSVVVSPVNPILYGVATK